MHIFALLAESKIKEWQQDVCEGRAGNGDKSTSTLDSYVPLEKILLCDIKRKIVEAQMSPEEERARLLEEAGHLHVQLASRLERSGYNLMVKMFSDEIHAVRVAARESAGDRQRLLAMLEALDPVQ